MARFIKVGDSALNLNDVSKLELKEARPRTYYVHVKDSAMLYQTTGDAVAAALSVLVPVQQTVKVYTLAWASKGADIAPEDVDFRYRGPATHIVTSPLETGPYNRYVTAGFSTMEAGEFYEARDRAVIHACDGLYWGVHDGEAVDFGTAIEGAPEVFFSNWICTRSGGPGSEAG